MINKPKQYFAIALEPIHVGTGGQRLGRVDMTVVREPVSKVPYIPGTSLSGTLKYFADFTLRDKNIKEEICASTQGSRHKNHDHEVCPICVAFGYTPQDEESGKGSAQGLLHFSDAQLLASPVNTANGPVWLTSPSRLHNILGIGDGGDFDEDTFTLPKGFEDFTATAEKVNFGWVLLDKNKNSFSSVDELKKAGIEENCASRFVVVAEWLFSQLVNDNMEVRTSVVIDPETGAASDGGLFTFEAIPRGAIFSFDIVEHDYYGRWSKIQWNNGEEIPPSATDMIEEYSFDGIKFIGLGGMTTRGFGCLHIKPRDNKQ